MSKFNLYFARYLWGFSVLFPMFVVNAFAMDVSVPAGKTIIASGRVVASSAQHSERELTRRSPVYKVDKVTTGTASQAQFKMVDGGILALQENTELQIDSYRYDPETETGSAVMNLLSGGIRTISGKLKSYNGDYKLNTPVGSIGIRGTHFEVEIVDGDLFLAVWDGAIDLTVDVAGQLNKVSFGQDANFNFAKIQQKTGKVTGLLTPPAVFQTGHSKAAVPSSTKNSERESAQATGDDADSSSIKQTISSNVTATITPKQTSNPLTGSLVALGNLPVVEVVNPTEENRDSLFTLKNPIADRVGIANFSLNNHNFVSTQGEVSNAKMGMAVNFTTQEVVDGFLSFQDQSGEWFARFNGAINQAELELGINFASHGDQLAEGEINAAFIAEDKAKGILELNEVNIPSVSAGGEFELTEP